MPWDRWIRTVEIEPSLYAADFAHLAEQVEVLLRTGSRIFHWDVGDGHFVPPITMGPIVLKSIAPLVHQFDGGAIDVHLMTDTPEKHFEAFAEAGADSVTFHVEAVDDVARVARAARDLELQCGIAVKPGTPVEEAAAAAEHVDIVLCMSVEPGYSGQEFLPDALDRVRTLKRLVGDKPIQVDGGVGAENVREVYDAGATLMVAGSAIFQREDLPRAYRRLVQELA
jgi:ribulose-phosphate 3-epimerase